MKKAKIILAMLLAVSVFSFMGCGDNGKDTNTDTDNGTTVEETTDGNAKDIGDDMKDMGDDVKDGAEDMLDGTDNTKNSTQNNETKQKNNQ